MKVTKTITLDAPGLGAKIKQAREADPRRLTEICAAVGMTTANWYRIEAEKQVLPEITLRKIEFVLDVDLGVRFDD
jgi:transcriptional regulator with XRE-family HTH domain